MKGINFKKDKAKFDAQNLKILNYLKERDENLNAERWCNPVIHPVTKNLLLTVKDRILDILTVDEKKEIIELTDD